MCPAIDEMLAWGKTTGKTRKRMARLHFAPLHSVAAFVVALASVVAAPAGRAETYPSRPITVIVPFAAGGVTDIVARLVSDRMSKSLGQSVIVENVGGAGGTIGVTRLFRSPPDGYTLVIGQWTSHVGAGAMYPLTF